MTRLGYTLSCEEFGAPALVAQAERAEAAGFAFAGISDHFHPWVDAQGEGRKLALERWPNAAISGGYSLELTQPAHYEEAAQLIREEDIAVAVVCGPDPERHRAAIQEYVDAGYDHVYLHQVGEDQEGFFDFYEREVLPGFG